MLTIYHYWFCPFSRKTRIALQEKKVDFEMKLELPWQRRPEFLALNPAGNVPVLVKDEPRQAVSGPYAIMEFLEEQYPAPNLIGDTIEGRAETRRLVEWFDDKFYREVTSLIINEKIMKSFLKRGTPEAANIRYAGQNIKHHLKYIEYLTDRRNWLAGDNFTLADISAAAHLSCIDYLGDVPWQNFEKAKDWYARIKSRPSFQAILQDKIAGLTPAAHYRDLDF
ncbi:glutathione S-transferase family protein [Emcibacter nanhaiensis]|uniref:Glutathione S-transferase family protein n=1 Tax=Emcibacter nanhaiensis TaxID=1505037 RepID=A0A501PCT1_9PROT|nr:glutathione S-transferase family protein [Emcibacter nanhaiensis]TPD57776.1 glutathione S-transferase family protein [Emcibacter nanhaiensis]